MLIGAALTSFWMSGLANGILPVYPTLEEEEKSPFLFNVFVLFVILSCSVAGLMWLFREPITLGMTNFTATLPHFDLLCLYLAINLPTFLVEYIYILLEQPKRIVVFGVFGFFGQFLVVVVPLFLGYSLAWSFTGMVIMAVLKFIWLMTILVKRSRINWNFQRLQPYILVAFPIILYTLVGGIMTYVDGVVVMKYYDEEQLAIYRFGAREFPLALALLTAMSTALVPNIAEHLSSGLGQIKHRTRNLMYPLFGMSIALVFVSEWAYPLVFSTDFTDSAWVFNVYLLALVSRILLPQTILIGLKKTKIILWASLIETTLNLVLSLWLIQFLGLFGVALATVIAFLIEKVILMNYTHRVLKIKLSEYLDVKRYLLCSLGLVIAFLVVLWI
jgi:O-antigen/teichoic acid export membrane protein